jgi:hypothetical protein
MPRPPIDAGDAADRARHIIATSTDIENIKVAQSVLLPLLGLDLEQTAQAIGKERYWVSRVRNRFIRGESIGTHGGRRNAYYTEGQERELIESVVSENEIHWGTHLVPTLRKLLGLRLYKETKAPVAESTITDMLDRYAQHYVPGATWGSLERYQSTLIRLANANYEHKLANMPVKL